MNQLQLINNELETIVNHMRGMMLALEMNAIAAALGMTFGQYMFGEHDYKDIQPDDLDVKVTVAAEDLNEYIDCIENVCTALRVACKYYDEPIPHLGGVPTDRLASQPSEIP